ncbi:MAG: phage tail tape measure protein [Treponemataceae bacterium]
MAKITTGVELVLNDKFSQGIRGAEKSVQTFSSGTMSAVNKVNSALSGTAAKLGAFGLSFGVGAATKTIIDTSAKLTRLGIQAGVSADEVNKLKKSVYETASDSAIKIAPDEIISAIDSIIERTGDLEFAKENTRALGMAIQATGASGTDIGGLFAEFQKMGLGAEEALTAVDTLNVQGKNGAFTLQNLASLGPRTISAYTATGRSGAKALQEMGAALQVIRMGTGSSEQAATAFEAVMRNLTSPDKQEKLRKLGVSVRDSAGNFRSITTLMEEIILGSNGSTEALGSIFDAEAMRAFNFAVAEFKKTGALESFGKFNEMLSDGSVIQADSARMADDLSSNIKNLQTSFIRFADKNLTKPLQSLNNILNSLSENPENLQRTFKIIAGGLGSIVAIKGLGSAIQLMNTAKSFLGKGADLPSMGAGTSTLSAGTAGATPVYVTNMKGGIGQTSFADSSQGMPTAIDIRKNNSALIKNAAQSAGLLTVVAMIGNKIASRAMNLSDINNSDMSHNEKKIAKAGEDASTIGLGVGAIGGAVLGTAGGAKLGAVIGTAIAPGVGTAIGAALGAGGALLFGMLGDKLGRSIGESIAEKDLKNRAAFSPLERGQLPSSFGTGELLKAPPTLIDMGKGEMSVKVDIYDYKTRATTNFNAGSLPMHNTGSVKESRMGS